jgi:hypothetical protein
MRQRGPRALQTKVLAVICDAMARDMSLSCKCPDRGRRAQFQLWIFSYTGFARSSKKWVSRVKIGSGDGAASTQAERLEMHREFAKPPLTDAIIHITSSEVPCH